MTYVDGFVLTVPRKKVEEYKKMARIAGKTWMKHGALSYKECIGDDLNPKWVKFTFPKMARLKPGETVWFSFITYRNKAHRDKVNKAVMSDAAMNQEAWKDKPMPFDMKRMAYAGFRAVVDM